MNKLLKIIAWVITLSIIGMFVFITAEALILLKDREHYEENWEKLKNKYFNGIISKIIATSALAVSIYSIITRKFSISFSITLYIIAILFAYMPPLIKLIFR